MGLINSHKNFVYKVYTKEKNHSYHSYAPIGIISLSGATEFTEQVNQALVEHRKKMLEELPQLLQEDKEFLKSDFRIPAHFIRFSSGEGKAVLNGSVRGLDLYIVCDVTNYSLTYKMFNRDIPMGPDDYYQDLKRAILATCGRARRITVVMPYLYQSRQDIRMSRESLDCAMMIQELFSLGVSSIVTFDPHEPRVENASPKKSLDLIPASYHLISAFLEDQKDIKLTGKDSLMVVAQNERSMKRAMYYASVLEVPLGAFYRTRDYSTLVDGRNPILEFNYLGDSVENRDVVIVDDMLITGSSFLQTAELLKEKKARNIYAMATFGIFSKQTLEIFEEAYNKGILSKVYITNLNYRPAELEGKKWCEVADLTGLVANLIDAMNYNVSVAPLLDHTEAIKRLLHERKD